MPATVPLVDGNKRLAWLATYIAVASGSLAEVAEIAAVLESFARVSRSRGA